MCGALGPQGLLRPRADPGMGTPMWSMWECGGFQSGAVEGPGQPPWGKRQAKGHQAGHKSWDGLLERTGVGGGGKASGYSLQPPQPKPRLSPSRRPRLAGGCSLSPHTPQTTACGFQEPVSESYPAASWGLQTLGPSCFRAAPERRTALLVRSGQEWPPAGFSTPVAVVPEATHMPAVLPGPQGGAGHNPRC